MHDLTSGVGEMAGKVEVRGGGGGGGGEQVNFIFFHCSTYLFIKFCVSVFVFIFATLCIGVPPHRGFDTNH